MPKGDARLRRHCTGILSGLEYEEESGEYQRRWFITVSGETTEELEGRTLGEAMAGFMTAYVDEWTRRGSTAMQEEFKVGGTD